MSPECGTCVWEGLGSVVGREKWGLSNTALVLMFREAQQNSRRESWLQSPSQKHQRTLVHREQDWCLNWRSYTLQVLMELRDSSVQKTSHGSVAQRLHKH